MPKRTDIDGPDVDPAYTGDYKDSTGMPALSQDDLPRRYEALRQAALAVLETSAANPLPDVPVHQQCLEALVLAIEGAGLDNGTSYYLQNPDAHLMSRRGSGAVVRFGAPLTFRNRVESIRRTMALDAEAEHPVRYWPEEYPRVTELKAIVIGSLLQELAARLVATGDPDAAELADIAAGLAEELMAPTYVGLQGTQMPR